jgi:hypothetical protein
MRVKAVVDFIKARERHRVAKEEGWHSRAKPDPIISEYRFCNVRRNDDRVTKWILKNYGDYYSSSPYVWFALVVARLFNNEETLDYIRENVLPFDPARMRKNLKMRASAGKKNFNAAYIVSTNGRAMDKVDYVVDVVLKPMWKNRDKLTTRMNVGQLANVQMVLLEQQGLGSFMAAQVIADWKYVNDGRTWEDFHTFAASGPGSRRGLNRVMLRPTDAPWKEMEFRETLLRLRDAVNARWNAEPLTAHDMQNCLCEFDKYERVRLGEGRPKQKYTPLDLPWENGQ